uniref:NAD kinase 2, mitochondrial n=1 Tax=Cyprinodon variegatus TaxID=28743 RepID=A0A3Q2CKQ4_CYPVA
MARCSVVNLLWFGNRVIRTGFLRPLHTAAVSSAAEPRAGFKPEKVAVVTKTTRYEFEQQRYRYAGLSEEDLEQLVTDFNGFEWVQIVKSREYVYKTTKMAPAMLLGRDGTMLLVASKVLNKDKPVVGVNTDPERSEGHLCLPVRYTRAFPEALDKLCRGEFRWLWRQRIRLHLEGTGINPTPVDLHEQQLSLEQHNQAHRITTMDHQNSTGPSGRLLLPVRSLNEIFIGESLSSRAKLKPFKPHVKLLLHRASYYEISVDDGPWEKQKSSGLSICTGTGSKAWSYNINKLAEQSVEEVLKIGTYVSPVTDEYNESLVFSPEERRLFYSVREPISNRVFSSSRQRGFANKVCVRSRCWDACMVVDGGTSFEFNDGAIATVSMSEEDQLRTVLLEN